MTPCSLVHIQGDSRVKVSILGGDRIGHCKKLDSSEPVSHSENFPRERWMNLQIQNNCE